MGKKNSAPALLHGIPPELMPAVFPFHVIFDNTGQIVQHGENINRLSSSVVCGAVVQDLFRVDTPTGLSMNFDSIASQLFSVFLVECLESKHILKGQMLILNRRQGNLMLFLGSPLVSDVQSVKSLGLSFNDFALHDSTVDFLFLIEAKARMMHDLHHLAERLAREVKVRDEVELALKVLNQKLEQRVQERTAELAIQKDKAEVANSTKSKFLSNMSHELRTPLNAILGYTQILQSDPHLNQRQFTGLHTIYQSGEHLLMIINDLLDIGKIEAGKFELSLKVFDLQPFLQAITQMISVKAQQKDLVFTIEIGLHLPKTVRLDELRLRQIFLNLLSNAVKFTESGQITFRISSKSLERGQVCLRFEVEDSGIGIAPDHLQKIFRPFEQVGNLKNQRGGSGLGLSISTHLLQLMESNMHVESEVGKGSIFWFELLMDRIDTDGEFDTASTSQMSHGQAVIESPECLIIPRADEIEKLYQLALAGNVRNIIKYAQKMIERDTRYRMFGEKLCVLANDYQTKAILTLIERHMVAKDSK
ncbi:ATP-binding protein [Glaciimonas immobilis]|uniref:Virulence sensor protein BvgS n=1 Tax=Glaciimonas immobilis TaxID=728004 RepID=A0A840RQB4_9BURK|nr:ATP-binding protein [Glaciimonas immobilis]KAF3997991.1 hypothetical protein HAV38_10530 [Glaciimonas immobilis]MBB5199332.1 signal transduction histidine kinase [Glaciimonas immobilis]